MAGYRENPGRGTVTERRGLESVNTKPATTVGSNGQSSIPPAIRIAAQVNADDEVIVEATQHGIHIRLGDSDQAWFWSTEW